ncbi:hypothetical protein ACHAPD_008038 [Fusarium lateritium]
MATRSLFILSALAGLTTAGPCKPGSSSSVFPDDVATINTLTGTISLSTTKASAPTVATTDETLLGSDTTALISYSMDVTSTTSLATEFSSDTTTDTTETTGADPTADPTTDTTLTTLWTSLASTETTTEPATTTSEASVPELTCPDARGMCFGTIEIKCNYAAFGDFRQLEGVSTLRRVPGGFGLQFLCPPARWDM